MQVEEYTFTHPTSFIVCGATQTGKSTFVKNLLVNSENLLRPTPKVTYLFYKFWQPIYDVMKKMELLHILYKIFLK